MPRTLPVRSFLFAVCALATAAVAQSPAPVVEGAVRSAADPRCVDVRVAWPNAWRNARNHDAVWLVVRGEDPRKPPLQIAATGHALVEQAPTRAALSVVDGGLGAFLALAEEHRGDVAWHLRLRLSEEVPERFSVWAVGMVFVPGGAFELGDDDAQALRFGAFHRGGDGGVFRVEDEAEIAVGEADGQLWYATDANQYRGDQGGPIPSAYPKGTRAFYVMKHELSQGAYTDWLNALPAAWAKSRAPLDLEGQEVATCSIRRDGARFVAAAPQRPCNFVTWDDTCAWADWHGLRPMTEFEFEKAARGPERPVAGDFPWGSADDRALKRLVTRTRDLSFASVADERDLADANRAEHGASYYWVMDLSGSLWERVVSAGHARGRAFRGTHGDGVLSDAGMATNGDWPTSEGRDAHGVGYRGGAEYFGRRVPENLTNPHSPVAFRTYAGWGGCYRYKTYSARACRTVGAMSSVRLEVAK